MFSKKLCRHCSSEMVSSAAICPYCRNSQYISTKQVMRSQYPDQYPANNVYSETDYTRPKSTTGGWVVFWVSLIFMSWVVYNLISSYSSILRN